MDVLERIIAELSQELARAGLREARRKEDQDEWKIELLGVTPANSRLGAAVPISLLLEHRSGQKMVVATLYTLTPKKRVVESQGAYYHQRPEATRHLLKGEILVWFGRYLLTQTSN